MIHRRKAGRAAAAVLAACLLFSACGPNLFQTQAEERPPVVHADVDFSTLEYARPDLDALNAKIDTALEQVSAGDKEEETLALYDDILADISELDTMSAIAGIRYNIDLTDEYYEAEELALDEAYTRLDNRMNELTGACMIPQKFPVVKIKMWSFPRIGGKFPVFVPRMGLTNRFFS